MAMSSGLFIGGEVAQKDKGKRWWRRDIFLRGARQARVGMMGQSSGERGDRASRGGGSKVWSWIGDGTGPGKLFDFGAEPEIFCDGRGNSSNTCC
ncbi:hypothetical protein E2562_016894 [Oryza meyeriana var. granulata]|uniref:Uncharacterized protein n=1 Tax=Oryza meyeriana var. granulata TaxID=110450 RepID=A0A6G1DX96_9ORYZ|nr:hypothetical protein E2562_016894 [Oryza meyeriana var. granulata]